jgi:RNA polymerase sigma-70 factor, ECF subfamily
VHIAKVQTVDEDIELIERHLAGDGNASRQLVQKYEQMVFSLASQMLGRNEDVRDAAQEVFLNVLQALPRFRGESALSTWIYRIAVNTCIGKSKQGKRRRAREMSGEEELFNLVPEERPSSLERLEREELEGRLHRAIDELAEEYRAVIVLHYLQRMGYEQIAQVLAVPVGTVKVRLFRAKRLLQRKLKAGRSGSGKR